ncbi:MAG: hypothetical protein JO343_07770, partial [Candidatus Eremiobacteraeota bacterium]|nr:hypothetical protein [Candidatus Eremiobacteraeota bacterium]
MCNKTAVLAVHGISPQQRYGIQDEFATQLCSRLNRLSSDDWGFPLPANCGGPWQASVYFPPVSPNAAVDEMRPTVVRIHKESESDIDNPGQPIIDVYEAYWSPIDKNQTKAISVLTWILRNLFVPANTAARLYAKASKTAFDLSYFVTVLLVIAALTYAIVALGTESYRHYITISAASRTSMPVPAPRSSSTLGSAKVLIKPRTIIETLPSRVIYSVALSLVAAYLVVQAFIGFIGLMWNVKRAWSDPWLALRRLFLSSAIFALGGWLLLSASNLQLGANQKVGTSAWLLAGCVFAFRTILSIGQSFLVNCFGDVQIYCTHDENSRFFVLRQDILDTVESTLAHILRTTVDGRHPLYERIVVVA